MKRLEIRIRNVYFINQKCLRYHNQKYLHYQNQEYLHRRNWKYVYRLLESEIFTLSQSCIILVLSETFKFLEVTFSLNNMGAEKFHR